MYAIRSYYALDLGALGDVGVDHLVAALLRREDEELAHADLLAQAQAGVDEARHQPDLLRRLPGLAQRLLQGCGVDSYNFV